MTWRYKAVLRLPFALFVLLACNCSDDSPTKPEVPSGPTDATGPMIVVGSPARSEMIAEGTLDDGDVSVSGAACDSTNGVASLNVLGTPIPISGNPTCAPFDKDQSSRWGLSIITANATSAGGATDTLVQSYLRSPTYFAPAAAANASARVPSAFVNHLNEDAIDDGNRADVDDLATIAQLALNGVNWNASVPTFLVVEPDANGNNVVDTQSYDCIFYTETNTKTGYMVKKNGTFTRGQVSVEYVRASAGQLSTKFSVNNLSLPLSVTGYLDLQCVGEQNATAYGSVLADRIVVTVVQHITVNSGQLVSNSPTVTIEWTNLRVEGDWGPLSFISGLLDTITNAILDQFEKHLIDALEDANAEAMPGILESVSLPSEVTLPPPLGTVLGVGGAFDSFTEGAGFVRFGFAAQFYPKSPVLGRALLPYGALRKNGTAPMFEVTGYDFGAGIKDDAINQLLWAAWAGGAFDFDAVDGTCLTGLSGSIASIRAGLPPVLMPGRNGHAMQVGLGDLHVEYTAPAMLASMDPRSATASLSPASFYVSAIAGIDIAIDASTNELRATLDPNPEIHLQVLGDGGADPALRASIESAVRCLYEDRIGEVIRSFPLPEFDLGGIPGIPSGTRLGIGNATIERAGDYMVLKGSLEAR